MSDTNKGIIAWFARNSVAANLLMLFIITGGLLTAGTISKQMFPQVETSWIEFKAIYPGAAPQEVEEGITIKLEQALQSVQGLERVITYSKRGFSHGYFQVNENYDPQIVVDEIKAQIDIISTFPADSEIVKVGLMKFKQEVMYISLYGDIDLLSLKDLGTSIYQEIQQLPGINFSEFYSGLDYEISVEVSKDKLREYNLSFAQVAQAVRNYSRNMSAGQIRAENGNISLRVENQAYKGYEFDDIPIITLQDGSKVLLADIADVKDGLSEGIQHAKFNGKNAVTFFVGAASNQSISDVADVMNKFIADKKKVLPEGIVLEPWVDMTYYLDGRLNMMLDNMVSAAILVFLMLTLFLRLRLAFWVMMGLPVCFLGTLLMMPMEFVDVTINVTSLFAFILVLGIVVDDAIVVGESAHDEIEKHGHSTENVIRGIQKVAMPATFGVLTTVAAFFPFIIGEGQGAAFGQSIGFVVIFCLLFSLVESKLILPAHLVNMKVRKTAKPNFLERIQGKVDEGLQYIITHLYRPFLSNSTKYRYSVLMFFISTLLLCAGLFSGDVVRYIGQPKIPHDFPAIKIEMNTDVAEQTSLDTLLTVEKIVKNIDQQIVEEYGQTMIDAMEVRLHWRTSGEIRVKLVKPELRPINTFELAQRWRAAIPELPGVKTFSISDNLFGNDREGGDISFRLKSKNDEQLLAAAQALKEKLKSLKGVGDVNDNRGTNNKEIHLSLKPLAYSLGLNLSDLARQVNHSFYGVEAQRILRGTDEIKVMVRYPLNERNGLGHVNDVVILAPNGSELPLSEVADIKLVDGVSRIRRENGNRTINIWASLDSSQVQPTEFAQDIRKNYIPKLLRQYPQVDSNLYGRIQQELDSQKEQQRNFILSLLVIFALLAVPLKSYSQALMIMTVIPFGVIGAVFGHIILGMDLSSLSVFGIIAVAGVVVNDSLVMVDYVNKSRAEGITLRDSVIKAGCRRFRSILLTSLTTFIGLVPIMMETSTQAKIVIPMAISLAFGVLFATVVTLVLIPNLYLIIEDIKKLIKDKLSYFSKKNTDLPSA